MDATIEKFIEKRDEIQAYAEREAEALYMHLAVPAYRDAATLTAIIAYLQGDQNALDRI